jgi:hypothetical protein
MSESTGPAAPPPVSGGCLCRRVRFEARPDHRDGYYCHCRMCQLAYGNTRAAFVNVLKEQLRWTTQPPKYYASSKIARRGFCPECGTQLSFEYLDGERIDLAAGAFDDPGAFTPKSHFAIETRVASWHCDDGLPGERFDETERLMKRWRDAYGDDVVPGVEAARQSEA